MAIERLFPLLSLALFAFPPLLTSPVRADPGAEAISKDADEGNRVRVEVIQKSWVKGEKEVAPPDRKMKVELSYVTYNKDKTLFVGYYQDDWFEIVSLHDAKTRAQLGSVYCKGGVPRVFRFSADNQFLGAEAGVGWYVWKIPSFEEIFVLGDIDFDRPTEEPQGDAGE